MPRSLLEILLEKKDPKKSLPYPTRDQFNMELDNLIGMCNSNIIGLSAVQSFGGVNTFDDIRKKLKDSRDILLKYQKEWKDYPWNDPTVQEKVVGQRKIIAGDKPDEIGGLLLDLKNARVESLGEGDSYRIANKYFETGESLRVEGTQKILRIASMRDKEIKVDRSRANTDLTENNEINSEKLDITAKIQPDRSAGTKPPNTSDDDWANHLKKIEEDNKKIAEENKKRRENVIKTRKGMFYYLGSILGQTQKEIEDKWGGGNYGEDDPSEDQKANRKELLLKAMPFIQKVTQKDFDEKNPFADKEYIKYIMVLGSYTPGYQNYRPDPEDKKEVKEITAKEKEKIKIEMAGDDGKGGKKGEIKKLIKSIKDRKRGKGDLIDTEIAKQMTEAENELDSVDAETACDEGSMDKLNTARADIKEKVRKNKTILNDEDVKDLNAIAELIEQIFNYCSLESYRTK
jgi:hypothetical protein